MISGASSQQLAPDICARTLAGRPETAWLAPASCSCVSGTTACFSGLKLQKQEGQLAPFLSTGRRQRLALQKAPIKTPPWWKEHGVSGQLSGLRATRMKMHRRAWGFSVKSPGGPRGTRHRNNAVCLHLMVTPLGEQRRATSSRIMHKHAF